MVNDTITLAQPPWKIVRENKGKINNICPWLLLLILAMVYSPALVRHDLHPPTSILIIQEQ